MPTIRTCREGCGNILADTDHKRFPEYLSRPLPPTQQSVDNNDIEKLNMRLRCSSCYKKRYLKRYYAITYRWAYENRSHSRTTVTVHDEPVTHNGRRTRTITPGVPIAIPSLSHRNIIMSCSLFFLDVLDATSDSGQWYTSNLVETYGSCMGVKVLLTASDDRKLYENRLYSIHQTTLTRDRGGYLSQPFGKQERTAAYSRLPPGNIRFYSTYGRDMGNIEVSGLVKGDDNVYQGLLENGQHILFGSGNTRNPGSHIAKRVPIPRHDPKKKKPSRRDIPAYERNPDRNFDAYGNLVVPTPAYVPLGSIPGSDIGFGEPSLAGMDPGAASSMIGTDFGASSFDLSSNVAGIGGSAALLPAGMNLGTTSSTLASTIPSSYINPSYLDSSFNVTGDASMASVTDTMAGMNLSSGLEYSFDLHSDYMNQFQHPGQM